MRTPLRPRPPHAFVSLSIFFAAAASAQAEPPVEIEPDTRTLYVPPSGAQVQLPLHVALQAALQFEGTLHKASGTYTGLQEPQVDADENRIELRVNDPKQLGGNMLIRFGDRAVTFHLRHEADQSKAVQWLRIVPISTREILTRLTVKRCIKQGRSVRRAHRQQLQEAHTATDIVRKELTHTKARVASLSRALNSITKEREVEREEHARALVEERKRGQHEERHASEQRRLAWEAKHALRESAKALRMGEELFVPRYRVMRKRVGPKTKLSLLRARWDSRENWLLLSFQLHDEELEPFRPTLVHAADGSKSTRNAVIVHVEKSADDPSTSYGVVAIRHDTSAAMGSLRVQLLDRASRVIGADIAHWDKELSPREQMLREIEEREAREARAQQLAIGPKLAGGAFWLSNGEAGNGRDLAAAGFLGGGVRLSKGISELFVFEAELSGGRTGEVSFDVDDDSVTRTATFGRTQLGAALRFGHQLIPTARLGIGLQGANYDGLESGFEVSAFYTFGGGLMYRFGEHVSAGASLAYLEATDQNYRSLAAGLYAGYGWNP